MIFSWFLLMVLGLLFRNIHELLILIVVVLLLLIFGFSLVGPVMSKVEEPGYVIEASDANIEIRYYN